MQTKTTAHVKKPVDIINKKLKILSELTEHTLANEIEAPKEVLRKEFQK